jgi:micrococcal nuclease
MSMPSAFYGLLTCVLLSILSPVYGGDKPPEKVKGKVTRVIDGDTFDLLLDKKTVRIRLNAIDAPEKGQDYYQKSKQALTDLISGKTVTLELLKKDKYQRWVADVYNGKGQYINGWMISGGHAWYYTEYSKSAPLAAAQATAKRQKLGLWAYSKPVAPWDYREKQEKGSTKTKHKKAA